MGTIKTIFLDNGKFLKVTTTKSKIDVSDILDYDVLLIKWTLNDSASEKSPWKIAFVDIKTSFKLGLIYQFADIYEGGNTWQSLNIAIYNNYIEYWSAATVFPTAHMKWVVAIKY